MVLSNFKKKKKSKWKIVFQEMYNYYYYYFFKLLNWQLRTLLLNSFMMSCWFYKIVDEKISINHFQQNIDNNKKIEIKNKL